MLAAQLKRAGLQAAAYHAGLNYDQRQTVQVGTMPVARVSACM